MLGTLWAVIDSVYVGCDIILNSYGFCHSKLWLRILLDLSPLAINVWLQLYVSYNLIIEGTPFRPFSKRKISLTGR